jgi:hypothetical protein
MTGKGCLIGFFPEIHESMKGDFYKSLEIHERKVRPEIKEVYLALFLQKGKLLFVDAGEQHEKRITA